MDLNYLHITGTVGQTKVDLTLSIPVGAIINDGPKIASFVLKHLPTIYRAVLNIKTEAEAVINKLLAEEEAKDAVKTEGPSKKTTY